MPRRREWPATADKPHDRPDAAVPLAHLMWAGSSIPGPVVESAAQATLPGAPEDTSLPDAATRLTLATRQQHLHLEPQCSSSGAVAAKQIGDAPPAAHQHPQQLLEATWSASFRRPGASGDGATTSAAGAAPHDDGGVARLMHELFIYDIVANNPDWLRYFQRDLGRMSEDEEYLQRLQEQHLKATGRWQRFRTSPLRAKVYITLSHPETNKLALWVNMLLMAVILLNTATFIVESVPRYEGTELYSRLEIVDYVCLAIFTVEFVTRIACCNNLRHFATSPMNIIDFAAIFPFYIQMAVTGPGTQGAAQTRILRLIRLLRVLRLVRVAARFQNLQVALDVMLGAWDVLAMLGTLLLVLLVLFASVIYYVETAYNNDEFTSWFDSIPLTMYYVQVTMTTVGYGDYYAQTPWGRFVAGVTMLLCMIVLSLPISVISGQFSNTWGKFKSLKEGLTRGRELWRNYLTLKEGVSRQENVMAELCGSMAQLQSEVKDGMAQVHKDLVSLRSIMQQQATTTQLQQRLQQLRATLASSRAAYDELHVLGEVASRTGDRDLNEKLEAAHLQHKRLSEWMEVGRDSLRDARELLAITRSLQPVEPAAAAGAPGGGAAAATPRSAFRQAVLAGKAA